MGDSPDLSPLFHRHEICPIQRFASNEKTMHVNWGTTKFGVVLLLQLAFHTCGAVVASSRLGGHRRSPWPEPRHSPMSPASEQSRRGLLKPCAASHRAPVKSEGPLTALSPPLVHDNPPAHAQPRTQLPAALPDFEPVPPPVSALYCFLALITVLDTHLSDVLSFSARLQARAGVILEFPLSCVPEPGMVSGADQTLIKFVLHGWRVVTGGTSHVGLGD